jgi:hypothetical protein
VLFPAQFYTIKLFTSQRLPHSRGYDDKIKQNKYLTSYLAIETLKDIQFENITEQVKSTMTQVLKCHRRSETTKENSSVRLTRFTLPDILNILVFHVAIYIGQ